MPYTSLTDLTDRYGERLLIDLTDRGAAATGTIDQDTVDRALADTDALIDGYLAVLYVLPLATVPPLVADLAQAIAIYKLHVYEPNEKIVRDHKDVMVTLDRIAKGVIRIEAEGIEPARTGGSGARTTDRARPMTAENLKGFV